MKKYKTILIVLAVIIIGAAAFLYFEQQVTNRRAIEIPKQSTVVDIKFSKDYNEKYKEYADKKVIADVYSLLMQTKRFANRESVSDVPHDTESSVIKISIDVKDYEDGAVVYVYKGKDGTYYVERPYEGIYEIKEQHYNALIKYAG